MHKQTVPQTIQCVARPDDAFGKFAEPVCTVADKDFSIFPNRI